MQSSIAAPYKIQLFCVKKHPDSTDSNFKRPIKDIYKQYLFYFVSILK
jgi:hypothetical protein